MGFPSRSVEVRGNSAIGFALRDLFRQGDRPAALRPARSPDAERIPIYNTCASAGYNRLMRIDTNSLVLRPEDQPTRGDPLDDLAAQHQRPGELARSLLEDGVTAMKVWPFDAYAIASRARICSGACRASSRSARAPATGSRS